MLRLLLQYTPVNCYLARKIKCRETLHLLRRIIDINQPGLEHGLPLGNQTSQFFANIYLGPVDHFIKESLRIRGYLRYVDDLWLFGKDKKELWNRLQGISHRLNDLTLIFKKKGVTLYRVRDGFPCLGCRVFPQIVLMKRQTVLACQRRITRLRKQYASGRIDLARAKASLMGMAGHLVRADTDRLVNKLLHGAVFQRAQHLPAEGAGPEVRPCVARRFLEQ